MLGGGRRYTFQRLVRQIANEKTGASKSMRWTAQAMDAMQTGVEMWFCEVCRLGNMCAIHAKRQTLTPADINLVTYIGAELGAPSCKPFKNAERQPHSVWKWRD